jgi:hypothetical protein
MGQEVEKRSFYIYFPVYGFSQRRFSHNHAVLP